MSVLWRGVVCLAACAALAGCAKTEEPSYPGYAEGDSLRLAAPISGTLSKLHAQRGERVAASAPAFVLEQENERLAREEAQAGVRRAEDQLANLKLGRRPEEITALREQLAQAQAALKLSQSEKLRASKLVADNFTSPASLDQVNAAVARDQARVNELSAQLRLAAQGGRSNEIAAAQQAVNAARAQLAQAEWRIEQKTQRFPAGGDVVDVLYREGEWVPQGAPVLTLLPPANVKARFFVPEPVLGKIALGQSVQLRCDGCAAPITAKVSYIAREAEFTSPIIYSKENRATLVFMIEARPATEAAATLHPGQPLEVRL